MAASDQYSNLYTPIVNAENESKTSDYQQTTLLKHNNIVRTKHFGLFWSHSRAKYDVHAEAFIPLK